MRISRILMLCLFVRLASRFEWFIPMKRDAMCMKNNINCSQYCYHLAVVLVKKPLVTSQIRITSIVLLSCAFSESVRMIHFNESRANYFMTSLKYKDKIVSVTGLIILIIHNIVTTLPFYLKSHYLQVKYIFWMVLSLPFLFIEQYEH